MDKKKEAEPIGKEGLELIYKKKYGMAIDKLSAAIEIYPFHSSYYEHRSYCYQKLKFYDLAKSDALKAIDINPNNPKSYYRIAKCCILTGKSKEASEWLNVERRESLNQEFEKLQKLIAVYQSFKDLFDNKKYQEATDKIEEILKMKSCVLFELQKALCLVCMERSDEALVIIEKFVFENVNRVEICIAYYTLSLVLYFKGDFATASTYLKELLTLSDDQDLIKKWSELLNKSDRFDTLVSKAQIFVDEKNYLTALTIYNEAIQIDPLNKIINTRLHFNRAKVHMKLGNYTDAIKDLNEIINNDGLNIQVLFLRTECFSKLRMIEEYNIDLMTYLSHETQQERDRINKIKRPIDNETQEVAMKKKKKSTNDMATQCDLIGSYELEFISQVKPNWTLSRTIDSQKTFYPFQNVPKSEVDIDLSENEDNKLIKITFFKGKSPANQ